MFKGTSRATLMQAIEQVDPQLIAANINKLLESKKEIIWLQTLNFIYDRKLGKATQDVNVSGSFVHVHVRDPELLGWPKEALQESASKYDEAFRGVAHKFAVDAAQDGSQNQTESKPALIAEVVESAPQKSIESRSKCRYHMPFRVFLRKKNGVNRKKGWSDDENCIRFSTLFLHPLCVPRRLRTLHRSTYKKRFFRRKKSLGKNP